MKLKPQNPDRLLRELSDNNQANMIRGESIVDGRLNSPVLTLMYDRQMNTGQTLGLKFPQENAKESSEPGELRCAWNMNTKCSGDIIEVRLFANQIKAQVCRKHTEAHKTIMFLHKAGADTVSILALNELHRLVRAFQMQVNLLDAINFEM